MSQVEKKPTPWLWQNKIPSGTLTSIAGLPGITKTFWIVKLTAHVTTGKAWDDGSPCEEGSVLLFQGEDGIADVYKERFQANGVREDRSVFVEGMQHQSEDGKLVETLMTLTDIEAIEQTIKSTAKITGIPVKMVVIDPVGKYWGKVHPNDYAKVCSVLGSLRHLAERLEVAIILVNHFGKGNNVHAQQKSLGSTGIMGSCRANWGIYPDPDDEERRIFAPVKMNNGFNHTAVSYRIVAPEGKVEVLATDIPMTGDDIEVALTAARKAGTKGQPSKAVDKAMQCLYTHLADGEKLASDVYKAAELAGISERTLDRAKQALGVKSRKEGAVWFWEFPSPDEVQNDLYHPWIMDSVEEPSNL
jgi:hypothetical protein